MTDDPFTHTLGDPLADPMSDPLTDTRPPLDEPRATGRAETIAGSNEMRSPVGVMDPEVRAASRARSDVASAWAEPGREASVEAVPSTAAIAGHPLHPMIVPLPIGLLAGALGTDLAYVATRDRWWARASLALTAGGVATGALAATLGATDFFTKRPIREHPIAWLHAGGNALVMGMGIASVFARFRHPDRAVVPTGLALSLASGSLLLVTGWLGGELVYRYRIGVVPR